MAAERGFRRGLALPAVAGVLGLGLLGVPAQGAPGVVPVAIGDYEAEPKAEEGGTYSSGLFSVVREDGVRSIVPSEGYDGIFYPDVGKCDGFSIPLETRSIGVTPNGRFKAREKTTVENGSVQVSWKGHWTKAKRVIGTITLRYDGCSSTEDWVGHRVASAPPVLAR